MLKAPERATIAPELAARLDDSTTALALDGRGTKLLEHLPFCILHKRGVLKTLHGTQFVLLLLVVSQPGTLDDKG